MSEPEVAPRAVCYRCHKPQAMCLCARIPKITNRTGVYVLQHPRERAHSIGTARLARLGLENVHIEIAWNAGVRETELPAWLPADAALLYPGPDSIDLRGVPANERPKNLLVIDGTWHTARGLYRDKAWLAQLPRYRFSPEAPSNYRLRREPHRDFVSTIEAIVEALRLLEPETQGFGELLAAFDGMIDDQLAHIAKKSGPARTRKKRPEAERRTPRALVDVAERLVVAYVESWRANEATPRELVYVVALALGSGELFERVLRPDAGVPTQRFLDHMRLSAADFAGATTLEALRRDFRAFLERSGALSRPDPNGGIERLATPLLAAWNQSSLDLLAGAAADGGNGTASQLSLKGAYRAIYGANARDLDAAVEKLGLAVEPLPIRGRAAGRLSKAVAIARFLHARATREHSASASDSLPPAG